MSLVIHHQPSHRLPDGGHVSYPSVNHYTCDVCGKKVKHAQQIFRREPYDEVNGWYGLELTGGSGTKHGCSPKCFRTLVNSTLPS